MFDKLHYGSLPNRKMKSKGKIYTYARINFKKGINDVSNREQRDRAYFVHVILVRMANGGQHTQKMLVLLLKSSPSAVVKQSIEDAGEMEVYQAVQLN